jgi:facilitated trehalose transporter
LAGICIGVASLAFPVYLGETIHPSIRGTLGLFPTVFGNGGLVFCFILGAFLDWSNLAIAGAIIPVPFVLLMFIIPETPHWYISKGREEKAVESLEWLRRSGADISAEIQEINRSFSQTLRRASTNAFKRLTFADNLKPLIISIVLMFFQQFSGINAVIFYAIQIFKNSGSSIDDNLSAIIIGLVNLAATLLSTALVDRVGRKILIYVSNLIMIITLACYGTYLYYQNTNSDLGNVGWLPLACLMIYVVGFSLGMGPLPWLM